MHLTPEQKSELLAIAGGDKIQTPADLMRRWELLVVERNMEIMKLKSQKADLLAACEELTAAMKRYQMDVEDDAPWTHRQMMERARVAIAKAREE